MARVAFWTQPLATAIDFMRTTLRGAIDTGDLTLACYSMSYCVAGLLLRNDPLDAVWRESEIALEFARKAKYREVQDIIRSQQRFIATMQGSTASFSTFSDAQFDEATFEAHLTGDQMFPVICSYWGLKLNARFLSGDYAEALAAADKVKPFLSAAAGQLQLLDYFYFAALTVAALYENASADEQADWRDLLAAHREQLREWAENYPPTFVDKHALVSAEIARVEGRAFDAMQFYKQAIESASKNGFVQNEALAHEVAARFYAAHGFEAIAHMYLRNARNCYDRWGAHGKLVDAAIVQPEFEYRNVYGTLVGFWSPEYTKTLSIPGYHLHFLSEDRKGGGHLLECRGAELTLQLQRGTRFNLVLPETSSFLDADLRRDPTEDLEKAENFQPERVK